ncbi:Protein CMS1 [Acrodontium crateriforme]|uniref:Protein CMS1 n=1 Tax=Acrodontium crateriforme TaxID=150365 RepID=A0AAQ3M4D0_9PEZI|nr:Protein CMS1 [Acrodontium crateriforme]
MSDSDNEQAGVPLIEEISGSEGSPAPPSNKRKRSADEEENEKPISKRAAKLAKSKKSKKPADVVDDALDTELGINKAIAHMESRLMADHIAQRTKRFQPDLSLVEVEELFIPEKAIVDTTMWKKERATEHLPKFLGHFAGVRKNKKAGKGGPKLEVAPDEKGSPHTLVIAGAGLRAADLTRSLRQFQTKEGMVAKLFAKHIKLKEAIETVEKTRINIGVGTPQRIIDLLDNGALKISSLERIVIDASHIDQKKRGILDMKETQAPLVQLLSREDLKEKYGREEGKAWKRFSNEIALFPISCSNIDARLPPPIPPSQRLQKGTRNYAVRKSFPPFSRTTSPFNPIFSTEHASLITAPSFTMVFSVMRLILAVQIVFAATCIDAAPIAEEGTGLGCGAFITKATTGGNFKVLRDCVLEVIKPAIAAMHSSEDSHHATLDASSEVIHEIVQASHLIKRIDTGIPFIPVDAPAPATVMEKNQALPAIDPRNANSQQDGGRLDCGEEMQCAGMPQKRDPTFQQDFTPECVSGGHKQCVGSLKREPVTQQDDSPPYCESGDHQQCAGFIKRGPVTQQDDSAPYCTSFGDQCGNLNDGIPRDTTSF